MRYLETVVIFIRACFWMPLITIAIIISNRGPLCGPDIKGRDNRLFKWLPWGK